MSDPTSRAGLLEQAARLHERGEFARAEQAYSDVLASQPDDADALHLLGVLLIQTGREDDGFQLIDKALAIRPGFIEACFNRGVALMRANRPQQALASFDRALAIRADIADVHYNRGAALAQLNRPGEALAGFDRTLTLRPDHLDAHYSRAVALGQLDRHDEAVAAFDTVVRMAPGAADAHFSRGVALSRLNRFDEALVSFDRALALQPKDVEILVARGVALLDLRRLEDALAALDKALALQPGSVEALVNRAAALRLQGRVDEALAGHAAALAIRPGAVEALVGRGLALADLHRWDEAVASYDEALAAQPRHVAAGLNKALVLLALGRLEDAWPLYENRKKVPTYAAHAMGRTASGPAWNGSAGPLFAYWEQGLGDTLQFCRYASLAADAGAQVTLSVQNELVSLITGFDPRVRVIGRDERPEGPHRHCALLSLPMALGTTFETIPPSPAYLKADPAKATAWAARLGAGSGPRVGLAWTGAAAFANDAIRSTTFETVSPLLSFEADWVCIQKELRERDRAAVAGAGLRTFGAELTDFAETAALIQNLALVITTDTSVAHLAAAMGKPTWILLPYTADWRWFTQGDDSPWYPSARLFRQPAPGDWKSVVERVGAELKARFG